MRCDEEQLAIEAMRQLAWSLGARDHARWRNCVHDERQFNDQAAAACQLLLFRLLGRSPTQSEVNEIIGLD